MELLNKEQQDLAISVFNDMASGNMAKVENYVKLAKDFLQSLKPKIFICSKGINNNILYLTQLNSWVDTPIQARVFSSTEEALEIFEHDIIIRDNQEYFIYTEIKTK